MMSSQKYLCHARDLPGVVEKFDGLHAGAKAKAEQIEFLTKRLKSIVEEERDKAKVVWSEVTESLRNANLLPSDHTDAKYNLHYDDEQKILYISERNDMPDIVRMMKGLID